MVSESEVARLRQQIAQDYEAAHNGLHTFAARGQTAHLHRTQCTERISEAHQSLAAMVGPEGAMQIVTEVLANSLTGPYSTEATLVYHQETDRWTGTGPNFTIWIDNVTFQHYVHAYLEGNQMLPPSKGQYDFAVKQCRKLRYWQGCEKNYDKRIHISSKKNNA